MTLPLRTVAAAILVSAFAMRPTASNSAACLVSTNENPVRELLNDGISLELQRKGNEWDVCMRAMQCSWGPLSVAQPHLSGLKAYSSRTDGTCWNSWVAGQHRDQCKPQFSESGISDRLRQVLLQIIGDGACLASSQHPAWLLSANGLDFFLFQLNAGSQSPFVCAFVAARASDLEPFVLIQRGCDRVALQKSLASIPKDVFDKAGAVILSTQDQKGAAILLPAHDQSSFGASRVWGLDQNSTVTWLSAVSKAAASDKALAARPPLDGLPTKGALPRLMLWFAAAAAIIEGPGGAAVADPASVRKARDWMSRNVLTRDKVFEGTFLKLN